MIETIQGEGGIHVLSDAFVKGAAALCQEKDSAHRGSRCRPATAARLAVQLHAYGVQADIVSTAKAWRAACLWVL
jgi:acetylornithine/succinyldiaminopimelate/putrescine aminotransferase